MLSSSNIAVPETPVLRTGLVKVLFESISANVVVATVEVVVGKEIIPVPLVIFDVIAVAWFPIYE